jgi:large subunit ribosomal protein L25
MAETLLKIEPRSTTGSRAARLLRKSNLVPGVIYSHGETAENIAVDPKEIQAVVHAGKGVIDIETGGKKEKAIVREVQWCHLGREILHVDLGRVKADEKVRLHVPVQTKGMSPGVNSGGVLELPLHSLDVECLVTNAPTAIIVNISELLIGSAVHVRDLILPEGVKVLNEAELVVVHVVERRDEPAPTAVLAEPEVVTKKKVDESKE